MSVDFTFRIGRDHEVCQDYASGGALLNGDPYVALSDGCSGAQHSDWGSRLLCQMAPRWVQGDVFKGAQNVWMLQGLVERLALPMDCLLATLLVAKRDADKFRVWVHGDGSVVGITHDGEIHIRTIRFEFSPKQKGSLPAYLAYHIRPEDRKLYNQDCAEGLREVVDENGVSESRRGTDDPDVFDFPLDRYKAVLLFSDGVESFQDERSARVPSEDVIRELSTISSLQGSFVQRSVSYHLKKMKARGWSHYDDLSVAGIRA